MQKILSIRLGLFMGIILAGLAWVIYTPRLAVDDTEVIKIAAPVKGYPAPDFQLQDINGFHYTLSDLRGRAVVTPASVSLLARAQPSRLTSRERTWIN